MHSDTGPVCSSEELAQIREHLGSALEATEQARTVLTAADQDLESAEGQR